MNWQRHHDSLAGEAALAEAQTSLSELGRSIRAACPTWEEERTVYSILKDAISISHQPEAVREVLAAFGPILAEPR